MRRLLSPLVTIAIVAMPACTAEKLPAAPTELLQGAIVFIDRDFDRHFYVVISDLPDLERVSGPCRIGENTGGHWGDCISSIRVAPGWAAVIYEDSQYRGRSMTITSDVPNLAHVSGPCSRGFDDCISAIQIKRQQEIH